MKKKSSETEVLIEDEEIGSNRNYVLSLFITIIAWLSIFMVFFTICFLIISKSITECSSNPCKGKGSSCKEDFKFDGWAGFRLYDCSCDNQTSIMQPDQVTCKEYGVPINIWSVMTDDFIAEASVMITDRETDSSLWLTSYYPPDYDCKMPPFHLCLGTDPMLWGVNDYSLGAITIHATNEADYPDEYRKWLEDASILIKHETLAMIDDPENYEEDLTSYEAADWSYDLTEDGGFRMNFKNRIQGNIVRIEKPSNSSHACNFIPAEVLIYP